MVSIPKLFVVAGLWLCCCCAAWSSDSVVLTINAGTVLYTAGAAPVLLDRAARVDDPAAPASLDGTTLAAIVLDSVDAQTQGVRYPPDPTDLLTVVPTASGSPVAILVPGRGGAADSTVYVAISTSATLILATATTASGQAQADPVAIGTIRSGGPGGTLTIGLTREASLPYTSALLQRLGFANYRTSSPTLSVRTIGVSLTDTAGHTVSATTKVEEVAADAPPVATGGTATIRENTTGSITLGGTDPTARALTFVVTATTNGVVQDLSPTEGTCAFVPDTNFSGTATIVYTVTNGVATSAPGTITVTVLAVNQAPSFVAGGDVEVAQNCGAVTRTGWAGAISPGPANEASQVVAFRVAASLPKLFLVQPAVTASGGALTFTPAANVSGSSTVAVTAVDSGGTANGGSDTSATAYFIITITPGEGAPVALPMTVYTVPGVTWSGSVKIVSSTPGATLSYGLGGGVSIGTLAVASSTGLVTFRPTAAGKEITSLTVSDGTYSTVVPVTVVVSAYGDLARPRILSVVDRETAVRGSTWSYTVTVDPASLTSGAQLQVMVQGNSLAQVAQVTSTSAKITMPVTTSTPIYTRFTVVASDGATGASDAQTIILAITDGGTG